MQIIPLNNIIKSIDANGTKSTAGTSGSGFNNIFSDMINNLKETEATAASENEKLLTGETDDVHTAMIASQKAEIAVNLAVTIRDKVITAYNEVMNMQI